jgi:hypothetical protein
MHGVPGPAQLVGEADDASRQTQRVMKQGYFGHSALQLITNGRKRTNTVGTGDTCRTIRATQMT